MPDRRAIPPFDVIAGGQRNLIEHAFCRIKEWRAIAARHDKTDPKLPPRQRGAGAARGTAPASGSPPAPAIDQLPDWPRASSSARA